MSNRRRVRRGTILFEVVVGMTILAIAGIGWVTLLAQTRASIAQMRVREDRLRAARDILERYRLLEPADLDAQLGTIPLGAFTISIAPVAPRLYSLVARDTGVRRVLLSTTVYARAEADSVQ